MIQQFTTMVKGDVFECNFTVSESVHSQFIALFRDQNPLHTNKHFAESKGFKGLVMHGNILNGFVSYFVGEVLPVKNVIIQAQEIKFFHPVYLNDPLSFRAEITEMFDSVNSFEIKYYFENQLKQKVAKGKILIGLI